MKGRDLVILLMELDALPNFHKKDSTITDKFLDHKIKLFSIDINTSFNMEVRLFNLNQ
jgi:hypothetical protein